MEPKPQIKTGEGSRTFELLGSAGGTITTTELQESNGLKIGDRLILRPEKASPMTSPYIAMAKDIRVVGFDDRGATILQIDGNRVIRSLPEDVLERFNKV